MGETSTSLSSKSLVVDGNNNLVETKQKHGVSEDASSCSVTVCERT